MTIDSDDGTPSVAKLTYLLGSYGFSMVRRAGDDAYQLESSDFAFTKRSSRVARLPAPVRFYGFPPEIRRTYENARFLSDLEYRFEERLSRVRYLGPLREDPKRLYIYSGSAPSDVGRRGEFAVDVLIAARHSETRASRGWLMDSADQSPLPMIDLDRLVAEWLQELGLIDSFELTPVDPRETIYQVRVKKSLTSAPVSLTDVGFGVSQVLPVLVMLAHARRGDAVILEQPEIHLHPAVQSGLADVIIETAVARGVQIILESHSEHLLSRLQRRLAEFDLARGLHLEPKNVAAYFCDHLSEPGESRLSRLEMDEFGNITNWPREFFGNPMEDTVAMMEAEARRTLGGDRPQ